MGELSYETWEIQDRLDRVSGIGQLSELNTTAKSDLVAAINELFTSASEGKNGAVAALAAQGIVVSTTDDWATITAAMTSWAGDMNAQVEALQGQVETLQGEVANRIDPLIVNGSSITPTGAFASATYYNVDFGVKVSYTKGGDVIVTMKGGTDSSYENLIFRLSTSISGVTLSQGAETTWSVSVSPVGHIYSCVISGLTVKANMAVVINSINSTTSTTICAITLTAV